ncbi:MAG TPA: hypothetical protein VGP85_03815 [Pyrinomonadaceae bacterium]|nr:hypothetical protein [Pyrinomonadaceae bacterium]
MQRPAVALLQGYVLKTKRRQVGFGPSLVFRHPLRDDRRSTKYTNEHENPYKPQPKISKQSNSASLTIAKLRITAVTV